MMSCSTTKWTFRRFFNRAATMWKTLASRQVFLPLISFDNSLSGGIVGLVLGRVICSSSLSVLASLFVVKIITWCVITGNYVAYCVNSWSSDKKQPAHYVELTGVWKWATADGAAAHHIQRDSLHLAQITAVVGSQEAVQTVWLSYSTRPLCYLKQQTVWREIFHLQLFAEGSGSHTLRLKVMPRLNLARHFLKTSSAASTHSDRKFLQ